MKPIDEMNEQELLSTLSEMYLGESKDPQTLCIATFREFDQNHALFLKWNKLQARLFTICHQRGDAWTVY